MDTSMLFSLNGRTALVTGGSRGIGRMIASGLLAQGAKVYITARKEAACNAAAAELAAIGDCVSLPGDVATMSGIDRLVSEISARESSLEILVNNAGAAWNAPFDDFPEAGWDKVMAINTKAPFFLTQKLVPLLTPLPGRGLSKVINIASVDGLTLDHNPTFSYHASKAGIIHLTNRMAVELAPRGINVTAIAPGAFASEMNVAARDHAAEIAAIVPAGRIGEPEDMAAAAIYLASRAGDYVVGTTLTVDGGVSHTRGALVR
ncbi:putative oxidoreductase [metagenome]|uniref:Putative oxidoreductase n=1 Tax=metagenome TaxID=256318 RepID=A0A2P2C0K3_9ZZZZ